MFDTTLNFNYSYGFGLDLSNNEANDLFKIGIIFTINVKGCLTI